MPNFWDYLNQLMPQQNMLLPGFTPQGPLDQMMRGQNPAANMPDLNYQQALRDPAGTVMQSPVGGFLGGSAMDVEYYPQVQAMLGRIEKHSQDLARQGADMHPDLSGIYRQLRGYLDAVHGDVRERAMEPSATAYGGGYTPEQIAEHNRNLPQSLKGGEVSYYSPEASGEAPIRMLPPPSQSQLLNLPEGLVPSHGRGMQKMEPLPEAYGRTRQLWWSREPSPVWPRRPPSAEAEGGRTKLWLSSERAGETGGTSLGAARKGRVAEAKGEVPPGQSMGSRALAGQLQTPEQYPLIQPPDDFNQRSYFRTDPDWSGLSHYTPTKLRDLLTMAEQYLGLFGPEQMSPAMKKSLMGK